MAGKQFDDCDELLTQAMHRAPVSLCANLDLHGLHLPYSEFAVLLPPTHQMCLNQTLARSKILSRKYYSRTSSPFSRIRRAKTFDLMTLPYLEVQYGIVLYCQERQPHGF